MIRICGLSQLITRKLGLEFYDFSYGFRPGKSTHQALEYLWQGIMGNNIHWIIDLDIRRFFDTMKHETLRDLLRLRVRDGVITRLIGKWLKAGVLKDGSINYRDEGSPQGGTISPLLSNIYLHEVLDKWYTEEVRPRLRGRTVIIRYADDVVMGFEYHGEAEKVLEQLTGRFRSYGLELHPDKTRLIYYGKPRARARDAGESISKGDRGKPGKPSKSSKPSKPGTFDFLGFTHYWAKSHKGNWVVRRKTSKKKFRVKLRKMYEWCRENRHEPVSKQHEKLCQKLKGHYAYYGITGNRRSLEKFLYQIKRAWKKWLCRRSWKGDRLNWDRYVKLLERYPMPSPKIVHSIYAAKPYSEEPCASIALARVCGGASG